MPEVNTSHNMTEQKWNSFKTFIFAYKKGWISRSEFVAAWEICQFIYGIKDGSK